MMQGVLVGLVKVYRLLFAWLPPSCRYYPSCSGYALEAVQKHGAVAGGYLAVRRICRCMPWCDGGDDPVPDNAPTLRCPPGGPSAPKGGLSAPEKPRLFTHLVSPSQKKNPS